MSVISLNGKWTGKCIKGNEEFEFDATVPGSSINDLINCGRLPGDIHWRDNADALTEYEECDYVYNKVFDFKVNTDEKYLLNFERLDTYCDVYLNGKKIATEQNGLISYSYDVTGKLVNGENTITVNFRSPITSVKDMPQYKGAFTSERLNTRRVQCTYGWDWVARFVSCGICGNVEIVSYKETDIRIADTYVYTKCADEESAEIGVDLHFEKDCANGIIKVTVLSPDGSVAAHYDRYCDEEFVRMCLEIPDVKLWYPIGYGKQPLYTLIIKDTDGNELCNERFGVRIVKIQQIPDKVGSDEWKKCKEIQNKEYDFNEEFSSFTLKVNGKKILCMGGNWVPTEPFCTGSTDKKITELLELIAKSGANMVRVWGGGAFESKHFYSECSRLGIMVTQDFLMACGSYPEDRDWFIEELKKEAEYAVKLIRNEPCLMWWTGDNENAVNGNSVAEDYPGRKSAFKGIAPVLYKLDFNREFLASSPYGGNKYSSNTTGTTHNTNYLGSLVFPYILDGKFDDYREFWKKLRARFIAEEPIFGAVSKNSLLKVMTEEDIFGDDDSMWNYHTKNNPELQRTIWETTLVFAKGLLGEFTSPEDRYFKLRYLEYEWVRTSMEQLRREMWFSSGLIFWMMNDCWPASSGWAIIDYYNRPKDAYYAFKRCAKDVVLSFDYTDGKFALLCSNMRDEIKDAKLTVSVVKGSDVKGLRECSVTINGECTTEIADFDIVLADDEVLVAQIETDDACDRTFYRHGNLEMTETDIDISVDKANCTVTVSSSKYVHAVELDADALFEDNCFSLMPNETRVISYTPYSETEIEVTAYTF